MADKGTEFERNMAYLFKQKGYQVTHDITMKDRSGAKYQIDVLAEYHTSLHKSGLLTNAWW